MTLMGLGPAVQINEYAVEVPSVAGDGPPVMVTLMDWALAAEK